MRGFTHLLLAGFFLAAISACSTVKDYRQEGDPNFRIVFKSTDPSLGSNTFSVSIFDYSADRCGKYMGTVDLKGNETRDVSLPGDTLIGLRTFLETGFFQKTIHTEMTTTLVKTGAGVGFALVGEREGDDFGTTLTETKGASGPAPADVLPLPVNCDW
jgi:hypothetical protein